MESLPSTPHRGAGDPVDDAGPPHHHDLRRPRRYWAILGAMLAAFGLIPLANNLLPPVATFVIVPLLMMAVVVTAARKQPPAVRSLRLVGVMWLPYLAGVVIVAVVGGLGSALYSANGGWAIPVATAAVLFALSAIGGPALDAFWTRHARQPSAAPPVPAGPTTTPQEEHE